MIEFESGIKSLDSHSQSMREIRKIRAATNNICRVSSFATPKVCQQYDLNANQLSLTKNKQTKEQRLFCICFLIELTNKTPCKLNYIQLKKCSIFSLLSQLASTDNNRKIRDFTWCRRLKAEGKSGGSPLIF